MLLPSSCWQYRHVAAVFIVSLVLLASWRQVSYQQWSAVHFKATQSLTGTSQSLAHNLSLPPVYLQTAPKLTDCVERLRPQFLQNASHTSVNYCSDDSSSQLTCFRTHASTERTDSACIGTPSIFDQGQMKFRLGCKLRDLTQQEVDDSVPDIAQFPNYWYETGTRLILDRHVVMDPVLTVEPEDDGLPQSYTILVRREAPVDNLFHHSMQILSIFLTLDILQMVLDPVTGNPFFRAEDIQNTRVVIFDDHDDGPFYDQWTAFAKRPLMRIKDLKSDPTSASENIIVPLPGLASPIWQGDWEPIMRDCDESNIVRVFSQRLLEFYGIDDDPGPLDRPLVLTFIDRKEKRSMVDKQAHINDLKTSYPNVEINLVDFASLSFPEQIKTIRKTDILAGIHGAGFTHSMFLQPGSTVVEIMPYGFNHKGFRNLARALGHRYFTTHAIESNYTTSKGWQYDDVFIEQDRFRGLMSAAIISMYHRGLRDDDVN